MLKWRAEEDFTAMASKASSDKYRAHYKRVIQGFLALANDFVPIMESEEAALKTLLRQLPKAAKEDPSIKRVIFSMKDRTRSAKKILRAIGRKSEIGGTSWISKNADIKLLKKMLRDQEHLLNELDKNAREILEGKIAMLKFAEKHLGWKSPRGHIESLEQQLKKRQ
jgi:hypothetical protein